METLAFNSIGFHAALILNRLRSQAQLTSPSHEEHEEDSKRETAHKRTDKDDPKNQREYVERRLRELAKWERRISGK